MFFWVLLALVITIANAAIDNTMHSFISMFSYVYVALCWYSAKLTKSLIQSFHKREDSSFGLLDLYSVPPWCNQHRQKEALLGCIHCVLNISIHKFKIICKRRRYISAHKAIGFMFSFYHWVTYTVFAYDYVCAVVHCTVLCSCTVVHMEFIGTLGT